jgi:hypothetical protein
MIVGRVCSSVSLSGLLYVLNNSQVVERTLLENNTKCRAGVFTDEFAGSRTLRVLAYVAECLSQGRMF